MRVVFGLCILVSGLVQLASCKTRQAGNDPVGMSGYAESVKGLDEIDRIIARHGFKKSDLSQMEASGAPSSVLSFRNALSLAWLSALSYGSAAQIAQGLSEAGFVSDKDAKDALARVRRLETLRDLAKAFEGPSELGLSEFIREPSALRKKERGEKVLPALYAILKSSPDLGTELESRLRKELGEAPRLVDVFEGEEIVRVIDFLEGRPGVDGSLAWSGETARMTLVFEDLVGVIKRACDEVLTKLSAEDSSLGQAIERVKASPRFLSTTISHHLLLTAEALDYGMTSAFLSGASGAGSGGLRLFSGGRLKASLSDLFGEGSTQLIVVDSAESSDLFFVFRGTSGILDLQRDFDPTMVDAPSPLVGQIHGGFWKGFAELTRPHLLGDTEGSFGVYRPFVDDILSRARKARKRVWITGHSLGGGLAVLLASHILQLNGLDELGLSDVYTFGAPMVGNAAFVARLGDDWSARHFRFAYGDDLIPRINPLGALRPDGLSIRLRDGGEACSLHVSKPELSLDAADWASKDGRKMCEVGDPLVHGQLGLSQIQSGLRDHDISAYIDALGRLAARGR